MTVIRTQDVISSVADALQYISYYHPLDFVQALEKAYHREESQAAKDAIAQILINSRMSAEGHRPICQDTGIVTCFVNIGMGVQWDSTDMTVQQMVDEGVRQAGAIGIAEGFEGGLLQVRSRVGGKASPEHRSARVGAQPEAFESVGEPAVESVMFAFLKRPSSIGR